MFKSTALTFFLINSNHFAQVPASDQLEEEVTKPPLTGVPQIDYVWDPNLPRELNGYAFVVRLIFLLYCELQCWFVN